MTSQFPIDPRQWRCYLAPPFEQDQSVSVQLEEAYMNFNIDPINLDGIDEEKELHIVSTIDK